jgi:hypothetical protein
VLVIAECPRLQVTSDIWTLIMAADLAEKGSWPFAGGWMEQTAACVDGVRFWWAEKSRWEADALKKKHV